MSSLVRNCTSASSTIIMENGPMASWTSKRPANARRITLSLTDELKNMLIKAKALTGKSYSFQLNEALRCLTISQVSGPSSTPPQCPAAPQLAPTKLVLPSQPMVPDRGRQPILPSKYAGMREQKIVRTNSPWKV